jgi:hypothetical protein
MVFGVNSENNVARHRHNTNACYHWHFLAERRRIESISMVLAFGVTIPKFVEREKRRQKLFLDFWYYVSPEIKYESG